MLKISRIYSPYSYQTLTSRKSSPPRSYFSFKVQIRMDSHQFKLLSSLFLILPLALATDVHYCDKKAEYDVKVSGVEISPNPIARGSPATFSISATAGREISGGKMVIDVSYFGWHIHSETHELCSETSCPVSTGDFVVAHSQVLPGYTPPGSYSLTMTMYDGDNKKLTCIAFGFDIGFASSAAADV